MKMSYRDTLLDELENKLHMGLNNRPLTIAEQKMKQEILEHRLSLIDFPFKLLIETIDKYQEHKAKGTM